MSTSAARTEFWHPTVRAWAAELLHDTGRHDRNGDRIDADDDMDPTVADDLPRCTWGYPMLMDGSCCSRHTPRGLGRRVERGELLARYRAELARRRTVGPDA